MTSNLQVSETATIKAVIDHTNKVVEKNEKNNAMKKTLTCKRFRERRRDRTDRPRHRIRPGDVSRTEAGPEDCISFNPQSAKVRQIQGKWKIVDGSHWMFDFGSNKREAKKALKEVPTDGTLEILATDPGSVADFEAFCRQTGNELMEHSEEGGTYRFLIRKSA